jgi:glucose-1-phosphate adenylyltransferase
MDNVLTFLLAGGRGTRLDPLTRARAKPAVPFGGCYRIIDFALSNCLNSQQFRVLVLTQYKSLSLERHITLGWGRFFHREFGHWLDVVPPQLRAADDWYLGTANAVYQNLHAVERSGAELLLVLASDHVYKMDYRRMLAFHQGHGGVATVAALRFPVPAAAGQFGVIEVDERGRVQAFHEKPECPPPVPGDPTTCLASMGIYVFDARFLAAELRRAAGDPDPGHDFGQHILPRLIGREAVHAYPHTRGPTGRPAYWRDVGTLDAYYQSNMDLLTEAPALDLHDQGWPVYGYQPTLPPPTVAVVPPPPGRAADPGRHNIFAGGTVVNGWAAGAVFGFNCRVDRGAVVEDSVLFDEVAVGSGAEVRRAVLDKRVRVRPGARVGHDPEADRRRGFVVTTDGVTCVPEDTVVEPG